MDGKLGAYLSRKIEERIPGYRLLGYFENGYRHISNRLHPVRTAGGHGGHAHAADAGKMHARSFELLGAVPFSLDLKPGSKRSWRARSTPRRIRWPTRWITAPTRFTATIR